MISGKEEGKKLKVAVYIRVSSEEQVEKYGIPLQREAVLAMIKSRGENMELAGEQYIYIDEGVSGATEIRERPAFARLLEDVTMVPEEEIPFDAVAVYKIDRFARKLKILIEIVELFENFSVKFMSANEMIDTSTPFGRAMLSFIGVIAELERDTISDRTTGGRNEAAKKGVVFGSNAFYGYTKDENKKYKLLEDEANIVLRIFEMFVYDFRSPDYIAKKLTSEKVLSPGASAEFHKKSKRIFNKKNNIYFWLPETITRILKADIYEGKIYTNKSKEGKKLDKGVWVLSPTMAPQIIDPLTFAKAQQKLDNDRHQKSTIKDGHVYLLSGLLKCDCCFNVEKDKSGMISWSGDRKEVAKGSNRYSYYYKCSRKNKSKHSVTCTTLPLPADEIEQYMLNFVRKLLDNPTAVFNYQKRLKSRLMNEKSLAQREYEIINLFNSIATRRQRVSEQYIGGYIDKPKMKETMETLDNDEKRYQKEITEIRGQLAQSRLTKQQIQVFETFSEKYSSALKKGFSDRNIQYMFLHQLIEEIVVYSRDLTKGDPKLAGRRTEGQKMPYKLHIKFKLPQDIMNDIQGVVRGTKTSLVDDEFIFWNQIAKEISYLNEIFSY